MEESAPPSIKEHRITSLREEAKEIENGGTEGNFFGGYRLHKKTLTLCAKSIVPFHSKHRPLRSKPLILIT
ncbi:hypothetical protein HQ36_01545 [Porphyromonas gingivicanis]|uniref:Uncharacterized protein n=1 Tax=Porphyromonas gingivicanis TaxID=266762 RepID=A0A0A2G9U3_9PORP|nr:hypothetical protein HQ36_01545 [Porphyromonas gingivicanis]